MPDICMQHLLSVLLIDGTLTFASSHDAGRMNDPAVMALRERFDLVVNEDLDQAHPARPGIVDVTTKDGRQLSHRTNAAPGTPYNPMDRQEVAAKAMDLTETVIGKTRAQRLIETVLDIEHLESLKTLRALLQA
jgi:2-methylcitrate dehydratase PrpD